MVTAVSDRRIQSSSHPRRDKINWCQAKEAIMLLSRDREVMLSEISKILEVCKSLVSKLSSQDVDVSVQSAPAKHSTLYIAMCSDDEMWLDQSDVSGQMSFDPKNNTVDVALDDILEDVQLFPSDVSDVMIVRIPLLRE